MTDLTPTTGSTPFPLEEKAQGESFSPGFELWDHPTQPHWYSGMGFTEDTGYLGPLYRLGQAGVSAASKGEAVLGGILNIAGQVYNRVGTPRPVGQEFAPVGQAIVQDARDRVKAMTPDPATTGLATQMLHTVGEQAFLLASGGFGKVGAAVLGTAEGTGRFQELREEGVDKGTAAASGALTGVTSAAGALIPAAYGSTLATRLLTGAAGNTAFGMANRYADHAILEAGGYHEMAEQQKGWDGTQMLVDAALGATFGAIHHAGAAEEKAVKALRSPDNRDAAMSMNLALRDRGAAPGVAVDPQAAAAHQAAMEKASSDLLQGKPVDVSDTGVNQASFLARPTFENPTAAKLMVDSFKESGFLDEEANLRDLENQFAKRTGQPEQPAIERPAPKAATPERVGFTTAKGSAYEVTENGSTIRNKAARPDVGHEGDFGPQPESQRTFYIDPKDANALGEFQAQGAGKRAIVLSNGKAGVKYLEGNSAGKIERRTLVDAKNAPAKGLIPVELWKDGTVAHFGNEITDLRIPETAAERRTQASYMPAETELHAAGGERTPQNESQVATVARAHELNPEGVALLAKQHQDNPHAFVEASQNLIDEHRAAASGSASRGGAEAENAGGAGRAEPGSAATPAAAGAESGAGTEPTPASRLEPVHQALAERPTLKVPDESGKPVDAMTALARTNADAQHAEAENPMATQAAVDCFARKGG